MTIVSIVMMRIIWVRRRGRGRGLFIVRRWVTFVVSVRLKVVGRLVVRWW
jgi:hypothetical protein